MPFMMTQAMLEQLSESDPFNIALESVIADFESSLKRYRKIYSDLDETLTTKEGATSLAFYPKENQFMGIDRAIRALNGESGLINEPLAQRLKTCLEQGIPVEIVTNQILRPVAIAYAHAAGLNTATITTASPDCCGIQFPEPYGIILLDSAPLKDLATQNDPASVKFLNDMKEVLKEHDDPIVIIKEDKYKHIISDIKTIALNIVKNYFIFAADISTGIDDFVQQMLTIVYPHMDIIFIDDRQENFDKLLSALQIEEVPVKITCINARNENYLKQLDMALFEENLDPLVLIQTEEVSVQSTDINVRDEDQSDVALSENNNHSSNSNYPNFWSSKKRLCSSADSYVTKDPRLDESQRLYLCSSL